MTIFLQSSITNDIVGDSVNKIAEKYCCVINALLQNRNFITDYDYVLLRPVCIPTDLGELEDEIKAIRSSKRIEILFNIDYLTWLQSDDSKKMIVLINSLTKIVESKAGVRIEPDIRQFIMEVKQGTTDD